MVLLALFIKEVKIATNHHPSYKQSWPWIPTQRMFGCFCLQLVNKMCLHKITCTVGNGVPPQHSVHNLQHGNLLNFWTLMQKGTNSNFSSCVIANQKSACTCFDLIIRAVLPLLSINHAVLLPFLQKILIIIFNCKYQRKQMAGHSFKSYTS